MDREAWIAPVTQKFSTGIFVRVDFTGANGHWRASKRLKHEGWPQHMHGRFRLGERLKSSWNLG
jgi:hypothetical protein